MAHTAPSNTPADTTAAAKSESDLRDNVDKLMQDNPDLFRDVDSEKASLQSDMEQAIDELNSNNASTGGHYLTHAAGDMSDLEKAVQRNHELEQMAEAYKLKKIIDQNMHQLGQEKDKAGALSPQDIQDVANSATRATGTLKDINDQMKSAAGQAGIAPSARRSGNRSRRKTRPPCSARCSSSSNPRPADRARARRAQRRGILRRVSQAFEQSRPDMNQSSPGSGQEGGQGTGGTSGAAMPGRHTAVAGSHPRRATPATAFQRRPEQGAGRDSRRSRERARNGQDAASGVAPRAKSRT